MKKTAFLFPGQGAQYPGMGRDFYDGCPAARAVFDEASQILGSQFLSIIFEGPEERLQLTENTQPAILTVSIAICRVLQEEGLQASALAGLSLGEYSSLVAAGSIKFEEALPLVRKRGLLMQEAVPPGRGMMTAVMGLESGVVEQVCREAAAEGLVSPANYNCPGQVVISGEKEAVEYAALLARKAGAKKTSPLKVSVPFHCALLEPVQQKLVLELEKVTVKRPGVPMVFNVSAQFVAEPGEIRNSLVRQVSNPILWEQSVRRMLEEGMERFIGFGPGNSLGRLMKRIAPGVETVSVETVNDLEKLTGKR